MCLNDYDDKSFCAPSGAVVNLLLCFFVAASVVYNVTAVATIVFLINVVVVIVVFVVIVAIVVTVCDHVFVWVSRFTI